LISSACPVCASAEDFLLLLPSLEVDPFLELPELLEFLELLEVHLKLPVNPHEAPLELFLLLLFLVY
jgi:hypothetical protein